MRLAWSSVASMAILGLVGLGCLYMGAKDVSLLVFGALCGVASPVVKFNGQNGNGNGKGSPNGAA